ncbi:MAG: UvrD-helicase domain-containing protein [Deltaproteobacteria bacterium]|jgi:DNA helicase-2/ATP-dependent DNA helicase PcrA|nr:UvrD-helicase domain-containing protein [Deltaproteobacteria bacterium]MDL1988585.1 UvrD-helicase domain-containing protein [Deltaproteobacteria bacterium]
MQLSDQQRDAVEYVGTPALVIAGAGSGKTRTLTSKIAHLVSNGYDAERILAITFTNKAADEMKSRLVRMTGMPLIRFPWVRTFHSACFKILKKHCSLLGYNTPLQIYAGYQQQKILKDIIVGKLNFDKKYVQPVLAQLSRAKNSGNPFDYLDGKLYAFRIRLLDVFNLYEKELKSNNAVDFDNILLLTRNLLRDHKNVRKQYRKIFQFILVDEYQDTNNLQEDLTGLLLRNGNLFCVGDDWQAIYSFRGSNMNHFLSFPEKYKEARVFRLEQNYRSADEIVRTANDLIGHNDCKMEKKCFSDKHGGLVELYDFFNEKEEADWVAGKIKSLREMGLAYSKIAVLYRTKFCSLSFEKAFRSFGIPYRMLGGKGFFERKEIMDINCYLAAAVFEKDDASFERIVNIPKRGIGPAAINKITQIKTGEMSLQDAARNALREKLMASQIYNSLSEVIRLLDDIRDMKPDAAINEILSKVNYMDYIKHYSIANSMDYTSRKENIEQLIYSASQKDTIVEYLEEAALVKEDKEDEEEEEDKKSGVILSTIHASKGLEYRVVFVVACEEQLFPHWKAMDSEMGLHEERRLMYVAMTRAEVYLFLTHSSYRKGQSNIRSRFLDEIEESLIG